MSTIISVEPVIIRKLQSVCKLPYPGRPHGCPNWRKKPGCPPGIPRFDKVFLPPYRAVYYRFDLEAFEQKMLERNPSLTKRQARCLLYWQPGARKKLKASIQKYLERLSSKGRHRVATICPEAFGVDVFATMGNAGITMEWPIKRYVTLVGIVGKASPLLDPAWWHIITT